MRESISEMTGLSSAVLALIGKISGMVSGRLARSSVVPDDFDPDFYIENYPDVARSGVDPRTHYARHGAREGRLPARNWSRIYETWLWRGLEAEALPLLKTLISDGSPQERLRAQIALARWYCAKGRWIECVEMLEPNLHSCARSGFPDSGAYLILITAALLTGRLSSVRNILADAESVRGLVPDVRLGRMALALVEGAEDAASRELEEMYQANGLVGVHLRRGSESRFDRLEFSQSKSYIDYKQDKRIVSVIIPALNAEATLSTALRGVTEQSWRSLEIIIVNDGSQDNTMNLANEWAIRDPRIIVINHHQNEGVYSARNTGLAAASGEYITVHDADDWSHPEKIYQQMKTLLNNSKLVATLSHHSRFTEELMPIRWKIDESWVSPNISSLLFRREIRDRVGFWDRVIVAADTEYYERIVRIFGGNAIASTIEGVPLSFSRMSPQSLSQRPGTRIESQLEGIRRDYIVAARRWHSISRKGGGLYLPRHPRVRPFIAPQEIALDPQPIATDPRDIVAYSAQFDSNWYISVYPDVRAPEIDAAAHYVEHGAIEGRDPGPLFSSTAYRYAAKLTHQNPLVHWEQSAKSRNIEIPIRFQGARSGDSGRKVIVFGHSCTPFTMGAERSLLHLLDDLIDMGSTPTVVLPNMQNADYLKKILSRVADVRILPYQWRNLKRAEPMRTIVALQDLIRRECPKEVYVNSSVIRAPALAARAEGVMTTVYVRELLADDPELAGQLGGNAELIRQQLALEADRFIAPSEAVNKWLGFPDRTIVVPNRVCDELFSLPFEPRIPLRVGLVCSNAEKKGLSDFLDLANNDDLNDIISFVVIGLHMNEYKAMDRLPQNVNFVGYMDNPIDVVQAVDIMVNLSRVAESFGRTVLEAQAGGRPVVCYRHGGVPELVLDRTSGILVDRGDVKAVADALKNFATNREELLHYSRAARNHAQNIQHRSKTFARRALVRTE